MQKQGKSKQTRRQTQAKTKASTSKKQGKRMQKQRQTQAKTKANTGKHRQTQANT